VTTEGYKSKYTLTDIPGGFLVQREGGLEVGVTYGMADGSDTYLHVGNANVGLYHYGGMMDAIGNWFMNNIFTGYLNKRKRREGAEMIHRALSKRAQPHWKRLVTEIAPADISELARLMWASTFSDAKILHDPALYTEAYKHLRSDLKKYHACRLVAREQEDNIIPPYDTGVLPGLLDRAAAWRELLAPSAVSLKALNKTLDKLPRGLRFRQIQQLSRVHLQQPITNRLHLIAILEGADHHHWAMHEALFLRANEAVVKEAAAVFGFTLKAGSKIDLIGGAVRNILDYPATYHGDLVGLARRSHDWHNQVHITPEKPPLAADHRLPLLDLDYAYLQEEGIEPLRTVGDVVSEGELMRHCVGSYAGVASEGHSFLFHVEHNGEAATIELSPDGWTRQSYGPRNTFNSACRWGTEVLQRAVAADKAPMSGNDKPEIFQPGELME
jgi:hypothetical protein